MPIQIQVPGKGIAEFPDDVSYDDAFRAIQEDVPDFQPSRADMFAKLQRQSESFAAPDRARFARQLGVTAEPSGFDRIASSAASAARGVANFVPGAIGLAGGVQEGLGLGNQINERVRKPLEGFIEDTLPVDPETTTGTVGLLTTGVAGGAGQLVSSLMPGGIFKNAPKLANLASSLMGGAQEFTDAWDRERERQKQAGEDDPLKALIKSGGYAAIATALESKLGPGHLAEKLAELGKGKVNNIIASAFKNSAAGGAEEFLQRIAQDLIVEGKPDWKAAAGEGLVGAIVQGGAGTTIDAANNIATVKAAERKAAYENWLSNQAAEKAKLDTIREQSANELAEMAGFEKPHTEPKPPIQSAPQARPVASPASAPVSQPQTVSDKMVRAIGVKSLIARGVDPDVAASFVNMTAPTITALTTEDARSQINAAFDNAGLLDSGANTFNTEANIRNAQAAEGWNESDVQNMLYDRRARAKEISDHNRKIIAQLSGLDQAQSAAQPPPLPAPQTPNPSGGESTNEGQIQEKGLQVAPASTPPPSSVAGEAVQPQPNTSNAVSIQSPNEGVLRQGGQELGLQSLVQGNPQSQVTAGTQAQEAQGGSATGLAAPIVSESKAVPEKRFKENRVVTPESLPDSAAANNTEWFHGGKQGIVEPSSGFTAIDSLFGSGFYLTDDPEIANSYAKNRGGNKGALYSVKVNVGNVLNLETPITPDVANVLKASVGNEFSSVVDNGLNKGASTASVIRGIQEAFAEHSAENNYPKSEYVEYWQNIESGLREAGYDAMTHVGGNRAGKGKKLHQVLILLDPSAELARSDKPYNKTVGSIDRIDAALSRAIEATNPFGKANTGNLGVTYTVLKLTRAAYRAGKSLTNAIKESIAQYRASNPAAQFNDDEVDAAVRIKLQDFLAGGEDALAIAKASEPAVAENERAAAMIHAEEYHRQRISDRRKELNRLHDQAVQQALGNGIDVALVPKVTSSEFPEFAASLGMDANLIQQLQGDVAREAKARRLSELQTQSEEIGRTITTLTGLDPTKYKPLIAQLAEGKQKLDKRIARKGFDDARVRAAEILDHTREFVSRKARLEALNNPDVKEAISGPVQVLRDLMAEYPDLRDRGVSDWVSDPNITDEVKRVVVARLSTAFREFDKHHDNVATTLAASEASLERQINRLKERISKGEIRKAYIDIVIEEARLAAAGETGLTGGLGVDHLEWFDANTEALRSFARSLAEKLNGTGQDALDARKLSDWILFSPEDAPPAIKNTAQTNWGVGDETLNEIIKALQESPAVRNAVAAIYDKGTEKLPAHELRRIATIALSGEEADAEFAQYLAKQLQKKQGTELFKVVQRLRTDAKNLLDARVRLETLREALKLFQSVEASPVFKDARIETETQDGSFTRQMFVGNENEITLRGFSGPEINQPEIKIGAGRGGDQNFSSLTKSAVESWRRSANQYITAFDLAQHESDINPLAPHPISLGFDVAVYRGLQSALEETNVLIDPSTYDDDSKIDFYAGLTAQGQSVDFNRQLDAVARMVEGIFGKNFQLKNAWYRNAKLKATRVFHDRKNASIPAMLSKAMASHPTIGGIQWLNSIPRFGPWFNETFAPGGNVEVYRNRVFNQLAHSARGNFVDTPKVGDILPSGEIVTQADLDLLAQSIKYSNDLLKIAQYKRGTVVNVGKTEFRRPVASVGVMGSPRHINKRGWNDFMLGVVSAFDADEGGGVFTSGDDLANGTRPWIQFWNRLALHDDVLTHHVLDSARIDRAITVSPYMKSAYEKLAASLRVNKYENRISNLEDLVEKLRVNFPSGTGVDAREFILSELGKEFGQYVAQSKSKLKSVAGTTLSPEPTTTDTADTRQRSSSIVETETMNNEFTKPAADLVIPSVYYDYSSITPSEMALAKDRAVSEFTVELKHSLREAEASLSAYVASIANDPTKTEDRKRFEFIRDQIHNLDLDIGRDMRKVGGIVRAATGVVGLGVAGALTSPVAAIGNVISSGLPAYIYMSRVSRLGKLAMIASALTHTARATKNLAYVYIDKSVGGAFSSAFKALSKSKNPAMVKLADSITEMLDKGMKMGGFANAADVRATGLSQTDRLLTEIANDMRSVLQFADSSEVAKYSGYSGKARLAGKVAATGITSSLKNFSKMVGLESGDLAVNMSAYQIAKSTEKDLKDLAARWAADRVKRLNGEYNPDSREWDVKPEEWLSGNFNRQMDQQNRLAGLRVQLSESGEQLESALWDYWKRSDGGKKDVEFFKDPDSFRRTVIGAINANILTNRPQKAQTNPEQSMFQTLMNYTSDLAVKIMGAMKTVKSAKGMRKWFDLIMRAVWGAIAALLVGLITGAARDFVGRQTTAKIDRQMTPMDKEFWNADENLPKRLALEAAKVMPFGQSVVNLLALNRPDAASGNFYVSFINSLTSYVMGAARVQKEDLPWLMKRAFVKFFPFSETALSQTSANDPRQINSGVAAAAAAVKMAGLERPSQFANASGQQFTEKTPILAKINEAGMRAQIAREKGDESGLQAALADIAKEKDRLVKFHKDALIEDNKRRGVTMTDFKVDQESIAAARKDWLSLNPLTKALGHQPTSTEMERISAYLSGDRKAAFDRAWNSYSGLAEFFPNGKGVANEPEMVKQERIAGLGRSGGGLTGGMSAGSLSASLRGGGGSVGVRRSGLRSRRGGISRLSRGVRSRRRSRGRTRGVRRIRF